MWFYMLSFFLEAPKEIQEKRRKYILTSLAIVILFCVSSTIFALGVYRVVFEATPGPDYVEASLEVYSTQSTKYLSLASLFADIALRLSDLVLVGSACI